MLRRVSSAIFSFVRTGSTANANLDSPRPSMDQESSSMGPPSPPSQLKSEKATIAGDQDSSKADLDGSSLNEKASGDASEDDGGRDALEKSLDVVYAPAEGVDLVDLPYTVSDAYTIASDGLFRAYVNAGFMGRERSFHPTLRKTPAVAGRITKLYLILQGPKEVDPNDPEARDSTYATQRKGLAEWAKTIPALTNLSEFTLAHLSSTGEANEVVYVPGYDEGEKRVWVEGEKGRLDASTLLKSLAWFGPKNGLAELRLLGVQADAHACRAWEGITVSKLSLVGCTNDVASIVPRLQGVKAVNIVENGASSVGCDWATLLSHLKPSVEEITLNLREPAANVDIEEFLKAFEGAGELRTVTGWTFSSVSNVEITTETIALQFKETFPKYGQPFSWDAPAAVEAPVDPVDLAEPLAGHTQEASTDSMATSTSTIVPPSMQASQQLLGTQMEVETPSAATATPDDSDVEMGVLSTTPSKRRSNTLERKKQELKTSEHAKAELKGSKARRLRASK